MNPFFSIVIPLYNKEKHIKNTLQTVFNQSFSDFEVIVVNDGSTDKSQDIIASMKESRLIIYSTDNKGVSHARNYGVSKAKADFIVFLDADDIWEPFHLMDLKELNAAFPNCGMYAKAYEMIKKEKKLKSVYNGVPIQKNWFGVIDDYFLNSKENSIASSSSVMIPKHVFETVGTFNEAYNSGEDTDLWIRIALKYPVAFYKKVSVYLNMSADNKVSNINLKERIHFDLNQYEINAKENSSLKKYLDNNRIAMAIQYRLENAKFLEKTILKELDYKNLNWKQKLILKMPKPIILFILKTRNLLRHINIDLRLFR